MKIVKSDLVSASEKNIITADQADKLWDYFESLRSPSSPYALNVLYYIAGILTLVSLGWLLAEFWRDAFETIIISSGFSLFYLLLGHLLWQRPGLRTPAGLLITVGVSLVPCIIRGLQGYFLIDLTYTEMTSFTSLPIIFQALGALLAAMFAIRFYKFSFLMLPLTISLSLLTYHTALWALERSYFNAEEMYVYSYVYGAALFILSFLLDRKYREVDLAFWGYFFSISIPWASSVFYYIFPFLTGERLVLLPFFTFSILLIIFSIYLRRSVFLVFGSLGIIGCWLHFLGSFIGTITGLLFSFILLGFVLMFAGTIYQKHKNNIEPFIKKYTPAFLLEYRPEERI